jgi:hypothetical protein
MKKFVLISCVSKKLDGQHRAKNLYISPLFKFNLAYAKLLKADKIFVLSAEYGLLELDKKIDSYNKTLNEMRIRERKVWAEGVLGQLKEKANLDSDEFVFLAGKRYREFLTPEINNYDVPMRGLGIGRQLKFLKEKTCGTCGKLHGLFDRMEKHRFPFDEKRIPRNGIYILFEKGEPGHGVDRIVRVGTHTGEGQLRSRLKQHFLNENKDRSIFRKNIGRALLNKDGDGFLEHWELDLTTREAKDKFLHLIDMKKQAEVEKKVSDRIRNNFSFAVFEIEDIEDRLRIESRIISSVSGCEECGASGGWFGLNSPKEKIRDSGLWLVNELYKEGMKDEEFLELERLIRDKGDSLV